MYRDIINVYIKPTNGCNLRCKHCFNTIVKCSDVMSEDYLNKTLDFVTDLAEKNKDKYIYINLFGGEPLQYDIKKLLRFITSCNNINNIYFSMTTNLVCDLNSSIMQLIESCVQVDGTRFISTSWDYDIRFTKNQEMIWENNVKKLISNNIRVMPIISITTSLISNRSPRSILKMLDKLNVIDTNFERVTSTGRASVNKLRPDNIAMRNWLFEAYCIWKEKYTHIHIPLFFGIEEAFYRKNYIGCRKRMCQHNVITINPDGTIAGCPNSCDSSYSNLDGDIDLEVKNTLIKKEANLNNKCLSCIFYEYCNGDCHQLTWDETGCPGFVEIFTYLENNN